jgi:hypothetical protein
LSDDISEVLLWRNKQKAFLKCGFAFLAIRTKLLPTCRNFNPQEKDAGFLRSVNIILKNKNVAGVLHGPS